MIAYSFEHDWIAGLQVGLEFPPIDEINPQMKFAVTLCLGIVRVTFVLWKPE